LKERLIWDKDGLERGEDERNMSFAKWNVMSDSKRGYEEPASLFRFN